MKCYKAQKPRDLRATQPRRSRAARRGSSSPALTPGPGRSSHRSGGRPPRAPARRSRPSFALPGSPAGPARPRDCGPPRPSSRTARQRRSRRSVAAPGAAGSGRRSGGRGRPARPYVPRLPAPRRRPTAPLSPVPAAEEDAGLWSIAGSGTPSLVGRAGSRGLRSGPAGSDAGRKPPGGARRGLTGRPLPPARVVLAASCGVLSRRPSLQKLSGLGQSINSWGGRRVWGP